MFRKSLSALAILTSFSLLPVQAQPTTTIDNNHPTAVIKLSIIDKSTTKPIANRSIVIASNNGIRCIKAPCPTNNQNWQGRTDRQGVVFVPQSAIQASTRLTVKGYLETNLQQQSGGEISISLAPVSR
jgi:hypothetical protein